MRLWGVMYYRRAQDRYRASSRLGGVYRPVTASAGNYTRACTDSVGAARSIGTVAVAAGGYLLAGGTDLNPVPVRVGRSWSYSNP